jgi:hypothetical protein
MENTNLLDALAGGLAILIFVGGVFMMLTNIWTSGLRK